MRCIFSWNHSWRGEGRRRWLPCLRPVDIHVVFSSQNSARVRDLRTAQANETVPCSQHPAGTCPPAIDAPPKVVVVSYTMLSNLQELFQGIRWGFVVVDESHNIHTSGRKDSRQTLAAVSVVKKARRAVLISGTPSLTRPFDVYNQTDALAPGLLGPTKDAFAAAYCGRAFLELRSRPGSYGIFNGGGERLEELHMLLKRHLMIRRLKADVAAQLPPKRRQVVFLEEPPKLANGGRKRGDRQGSDGGGDREGEENSDEDEEGVEGVPDEQYVAGRLSPHHVTGLRKVDKACEWLQEVALRPRDEASVEEGTRDDGISIGDGEGGRGKDPAAESASAREESGVQEAAEAGGANEGGTGAPDCQKWVIFAHHIDVMDRIQEKALEGLGGPNRPPAFVRIDGSTDAADRHALVRSFRTDAHIRAALVSVTAGGVGLDFTAATAVVFVELPTEVSIVEQAEDRVHRRGQKRPVNIYFLCANNTTDVSRWRALGKSLKRVRATMDGAEAAQEVAGGIPVDKIRRVSAELTQMPREDPQATQVAGEGEWGAAAGEVSQETMVGDGADAEGQDGEARGRERGTQESSPLGGNADTDAEREAPDLWFEPSLLTGRIHVHCSRPGLPRPVLQGSFRLEDLDQACPAAEQNHDPSTLQEAAAALPGPLRTTAAARQLAVEFVAEWNARSLRERKRLEGHLIRSPIADFLAEMPEKCSVTGSRVRDTSKTKLYGALPAGATWHKVRVRRRLRGKPPFTIKWQAYNEEEDALCLICMAKVPGGCGRDVKDNIDLFCSDTCMRDFRVKNSGEPRDLKPLTLTPAQLCRALGARRDELFELERGVCTECGVDMHRLCQRIRVLSRSQREKVIFEMAPQFKDHPARLQVLVNTTWEGNAWHADHKVAVWEGGGECGVDNLQTLCVPCHDKNSARQKKEWAASRRMYKSYCQVDAKRSRRAQAQAVAASASASVQELASHPSTRTEQEQPDCQSEIREASLENEAQLVDPVKRPSDENRSDSKLGERAPKRRCKLIDLIPPVPPPPPTLEREFTPDDDDDDDELSEGEKELLNVTIF
ncbi:hypothetical protein CYMTET_31114 [Cymbomonas tetramitiformis]|uniref:Helicase C-terminal domain-containing protein n=1 Tax=Cymbomonas tetramitiformis TaxID=36881 RepID=A0AAE0KT73_9CHLO|nr:hypothetical protein CYMTET_31114 [Cymbomonas tetramitiformis]